MKKVNIILAFTFSLTMTLGVTAQSTNQETLTTAVGITDVVVSDIPAYVAALKAIPQAFRMLGSNFTGFCQAVSGGIPGEALVFSYFDSMEANMAAAEIQLTDAISSQSWGQSLFANVQAARSQIVGDKIYRCEQIFIAN